MIVAAWRGEGPRTQVRLPAACVDALDLAVNESTSLTETLDFAASALLCRQGIEARLADGTLYVESEGV